MGISVVCCKCGASFDERTLRGSWLNRQCPVCGKRVSERDYDAQARSLIGLSAGAHGQGGGQTQSWQGEASALADPTALAQLASARYYTSEWFRLACAGRGSEAPDRGLFGLKPSYDRATGAFCLHPGDADRSPDMGLGVSAEYFVFDALRAEICRRKSPLRGSFLVPTLEFPWLPGQKPKQWGAQERGETDCIVLAPSFACVIEVKRRNHHVKASKGYGGLRVRGDDGSFRGASEVLEQVANGAAAFEERQALYPHDRIFRLIVFVEPLSFSCPSAEFVGNLMISQLDGKGNAPFIRALRTLAVSLDPVATSREAHDLGKDLLQRFGHTARPHEGRIVVGSDPSGEGRLRVADPLLDSVERLTADPSSALHGARLLRNLTCEIEIGKRGQAVKAKQTRIAGLLLTRSNAVFIEAKPWRQHVNTHSPFATVYVGDPRAGAKRVDGEIRHDWDLGEIGYVNRSGSLSLAKFVSRRMLELERHRDRNRVCIMTVFVNPVSFHSDCDTFKQRAFIGYWSKKHDNVMAALEQLAEAHAPIMAQSELDELADRIAAIGSSLAVLGPADDARASRSGRAKRGGRRR